MLKPYKKFLMPYPLEPMNTSPIIDSGMTFEDAVRYTKAPPEVVDSLCIIDVRYVAFDGRLHQGQLVVHRMIEKDVVDIFKLIEQLKFPVAQAIPIVQYDWSDDASMAANNTSAFNYRYVMGTNRFSHHAYGRAVDINPFFNPVIYEDGRIDPPGALYNTEEEGTFSELHPVVQEFLKRGWRWGGNFRPSIDYHHFDKPA